MYVGRENSVKLLDQIRQRLQSCLAVQDEEQFLHDCFEDPLPITPWAFWTLFSLVNHRQRQEFVLTCVQQLGGDVSLISKLGNSGHPNIPGNGIVPHHKDWKFYFHGIGCELINTITGEEIDVDFFDYTADWFDENFYLHYLESLKTPAVWEERVRHLHPTLETVFISTDELLEHQLLELHSEKHPFRLAFDWKPVRELTNAIEEQLQSNTGQLLEKLSIVSNDWSQIDPSRYANSLQAKLSEAKRRVREMREKTLRKCFSKGTHNTQALRGLFDLKSSHYPHAMKTALASKQGSQFSEALELIIESNDGRWVQDVSQKIKHLDQLDEHPTVLPFRYLKSLEYLLQQAPERSHLREELLNTDFRFTAYAAILALEYLPDVALELLQRALKSCVPNNQSVSATALMFIDQPWSHQILLNALNESNDWEATIECRNAMRLLNNTDLHAAVDRWESDYCTAHKIQADELSTPKGHLNYEMKQLKDHVISLRNVFPPHGPE